MAKIIQCDICGYQHNESAKSNKLTDAERGNLRRREPERMTLQYNKTGDEMWNLDICGNCREYLTQEHIKDMVMRDRENDMLANDRSL